MRYILLLILIVIFQSSNAKNYRYFEVDADCSEVKKEVLDVGVGNSIKTNEHCKGSSLSYSEREKCRNYCYYINGPLQHSYDSLTGGMFDSGGWNKKSQNGWVNPEDENRRSGRNDINFNHKDIRSGYRNGIIGCDRTKGMFLVDYANAPSRTSNIAWAFQNGPLLLRNGINPHNSKSTNRAYRTGMGFKNGKIISIMTDEPMTYYEFASIFKDHGYNNAIYLDGVKPNVSALERSKILGIGAYKSANSNNLTKNKRGKIRTVLQFFSKSTEGSCGGIKRVTDKSGYQINYSRGSSIR